MYSMEQQAGANGYWKREYFRAQPIAATRRGGRASGGAVAGADRGALAGKADDFRAVAGAEESAKRTSIDVAGSDSAIASRKSAAGVAIV